MRKFWMIVLMLPFFTGTAAAQSAPAAAPAATASLVAEATEDEGEGTTVMGDRESPIGLYITPWRNAQPQAELDRPAKFLQEELSPLDSDVFARSLDYYATIRDYEPARAASLPAALLKPIGR